MLIIIHNIFLFNILSNNFKFSLLGHNGSCIRQIWSATEKISLSFLLVHFLLIVSPVLCIDHLFDSSSIQNHIIYVCLQFVVFYSMTFLKVFFLLHKISGSMKIIIQHLCQMIDIIRPNNINIFLSMQMIDFFISINMTLFIFRSIYISLVIFYEVSFPYFFSSIDSIFCITWSNRKSFSFFEFIILKFFTWIIYMLIFADIFL